MTPEGYDPKERVVVAAVSGGPDSVYLLFAKLAREKGTRVVLGHVNYGTRGVESEKDHAFIEKIGKKLRYKTEIIVLEKGSLAGNSIGASGTHGNFPTGFEKKAREIRYRFLRDLSRKTGADAIALAHTADDQVETILMRVFEGAGIGGLKGIPRASEDGIVRPILDVWKENILEYLKKRKITYRIDRSNVDTRFERNWIRHVLVPLLEKRYGKGVKKRIFTLGERFRELDDYLGGEAAQWVRRNVKTSSGGKEKRRDTSDRLVPGPGKENFGRLVFRREKFSALPSVLRMKILQRICFGCLAVAPNERLLKSMDGSICKGGPSARLNAGKGWKLGNRYEEAFFFHEEPRKDRKSVGPGPGEDGMEKRVQPRGRNPFRLVQFAAPGEYRIPPGRDGRVVAFAWGSSGKCTLAQAKRLAAEGDAEVFDAAALTLPLEIRPLRPGDRIRPFGGVGGGNARSGEKKVKGILIDRKVPREERWGRPVVCNAEGAILWIPGVLRSALAPVTAATRRTAILRIRSTK